MSDFSVGDRVKFRAGRGYSEGRIANIADGLATISTGNDKLINRKLAALEKLSVAVTPSPSPDTKVTEVCNEACCADF